MSNFFSFMFLLALFLSVVFGIFQMIKGIINTLFKKAYSRYYPVVEVSSEWGGSADFDCRSFEALGIDVGGLCGDGGDCSV